MIEEIKVSDEIILKDYDKKYFNNHWSLVTNPNVSYFTTFQVYKVPQDLYDYINRIKRENRQFPDYSNRLNWSIVDIKNDRFLGGINLLFNFDQEAVRMGYVLNEPYWDKGIMTSSVSAVINFIKIKYPKIKTIYSDININNTRSKRVLEKNGFVTDGQILERKNKGEMIPVLLYHRNL